MSETATELDRATRDATHTETSPLYFIYVLRNAAGTLYTGIAIDVEVRLRQHNAGTGARFTRGRGPWAVCHREGPIGHGDALRREATIKADRRFKAEIRARLADEAERETQRATARPIKRPKPGAKTQPARSQTTRRRAARAGA